MIKGKAWHYCKDFLGRILDTNDDKLIAEHARCSIPMFIKEIDEMRSILKLDTVSELENTNITTDELLTRKGCWIGK